MGEGGAAGIAGATSSGGAASGAAGTGAPGGSGGATSSAGSGGKVASGGAAPTAGSGNPAGGTAGGSAGSGGAKAVGGAAGGGSVAACDGMVSVTPNPFGCEFAWGANGNNNNRASYLDFITTWVGYEANGGLDGACDGCRLATQLASTNARAAYYAYFIGYGANRDGFGDCNTDMDQQNLCTRGAQWIRTNRARLLEMYANYARRTQQASPNKGVVWLLEGDFIQYTNASQSQPLTMQEIGQLATDIVCAIKSNEPNAIVAINHSSWIRNPQLTNFFNAMPLSILDMVWTTGMGNVAGGYLNTGDANNRQDGTYRYLHMLTGKKMLVDTSFGASQQADSWSNTPAATLNTRISDGVIAANVTQPPTDYQTRVSMLQPQLSSVCP